MIDSQFNVQIRWAVFQYRVSSAPQKMPLVDCLPLTHFDGLVCQRGIHRCIPTGVFEDDDGAESLQFAYVADNRWRW